MTASTHLGYGATVHRSQGATVDVTHAIIDTSVDRAGLYVATTRGKHENLIYAVCETPLDETAEDSHYHQSGDRDAPTPTSVVAAAVARDRCQVAASDTILNNADAISSPDRRRTLYLHGVDIATDRFIDEHLPEALDQLTANLARAIGDGPAIRAAWRDALHVGADPRDVMATATTDIDDARDFDRLIAHRIRHVTKCDNGRTTPLPSPPPPTWSSDYELDLWLKETHDELDDTAAPSTTPRHAPEHTNAPAAAPPSTTMPGMPAAFAEAMAHMAAHAGSQPAHAPAAEDAAADAQTQLDWNMVDRDRDLELSRCSMTAPNARLFPPDREE